MDWKHKNFSLESHRVTTEDGYILTLTRLVDTSEESNGGGGGSDKAKESLETPVISVKSKPAVLLVHGVTSGSHQWFELSPESNLPYLLAKEGYDCWHANLRGTPLSKAHEKLKPKSAKFWDFSFHDMGCFDLPAMINYILDVSGNESLFYVGHSMGCSTLFVLATTKPEFCSKISAMVALAPAVYGKHIRCRMARIGARVMPPFANVKMIRNAGLAQKTVAESTKSLVPPFCNREKAARRFGVWGGLLIGSISHKDELDKEKMNEAVTKYPASTSRKTFIHGMQCIRDNKFQQYDYGTSKNMKVYGVRSPPAYDLKKVNIPVILFHSVGDKLTTNKDGERLEKELPNVISNTVIQDKRFSHVSFIMNPTAEDLVYKPVLSFFNNYLPKSNQIN